MRGENDSHSHICAFYNRYTPTCVGKTAGHLDRLKDETVHPHMRGENIPFLSGLPRGSGTPPHAWGKRWKTSELWSRSTGTPPHAWGKRCSGQISRQSRRYTPTCVGKTSTAITPAAMLTVHPHMRGENLHASTSQHGADGTPPHAWGKLSDLFIVAPVLRYTPTCVGKTNAPAQQAGGIAVHPHMRGENSRALRSVESVVWYTPTCVGKTLCALHTILRIQVHPHMRGENVHIALDGLGCVRYTPTCVGKTALTTGKLPTPTVHPHMRGENGPRLQNCNLAIGTPPHAWGKLSPRGGAYWRARYTPTCVGKTDV